jgi:hypothetical protein
MQLMSDRVAKGQILKPSARRHKLRKTHASNEKINVLGAVGKSGDEPNDGESPPTWIQNAKKVAKTSQTIAQEGYTIAKKIRVSGSVCTWTLVLTSYRRLHVAKMRSLWLQRTANRTRSLSVRLA